MSGSYSLITFFIFPNLFPFLLFTNIINIDSKTHTNPKALNFKNFIFIL